MDVFAGELEKMLGWELGTAGKMLQQIRAVADDCARLPIGGDQQQAEPAGSCRPAPKQRSNRGQPLREAAVRALFVLYGHCVPNRVSLPDKKLCDAVREYLLKHMQIAKISDKTILRAAVRM